MVDSEPVGCVSEGQSAKKEKHAPAAGFDQSHVHPASSYLHRIDGGRWNISPYCCQATVAVVVVVSLEEIFSDENAPCDKMSSSDDAEDKKKSPREINTYLTALTGPKVKQS